MTTPLQNEEATALKAIYDDDFHAMEEKTSFSIKISSEDNDVALTLCIWLPGDYPTHSPPVYELKCDWLTEQDRVTVADHLRTIFCGNGGEVVVYQWVEYLRDFLNTKAEAKRARVEGTVRNGEEVLKMAALSPSDEEDKSPAMPSTCTTNTDATSMARLGVELHVFHGDPLTDRKSTFQAHVTAVHSASDVKAMLALLITNKKIASASHNILAYRISVGSSGVLQQDCDDDGETAAGGRLLHLLQIMDARNVAVVVSRWFGGILLHADRFKHINNVARLLIQESGIGLLDKHEQPTKQKNPSSKKKRSKSRN